MTKVGDKITYPWIAEKEGTTFVATSELMEDDGKWKPIKHVCCDGTTVIQKITADNLAKDSGWWNHYKSLAEKNKPFVPKGVEKQTVEKKQKADKPSKKAVNEILEPVDAIQPTKRFLGTKGKEPTNVWITKVRLDELLKAEAEHKRLLIETLEIHDKMEAKGLEICVHCSSYHPTTEIFGCSREGCKGEGCEECLNDEGLCPACVKPVEAEVEVEVEAEEAEEAEEEAEEAEEAEVEKKMVFATEIEGRWTTEITKGKIGSKNVWNWRVKDSANGGQTNGSSLDYTLKGAKKRSEEMRQSFMIAERKKYEVF